MAGPLSAGALARASGLSKGAMTTAPDRLERAGYVRRVRGEADRRLVRVDVTARASTLMAAIWGPIAEAGKAQLAAYDADQLAFLFDFLRRGRELQHREAERIRRMPHPAGEADLSERIREPEGRSRGRQQSILLRYSATSL